MLGYFKPNKEELKMKDYYNYRAFYCGHCHLLKNEYSRFSSVLMSYEAVFISLLFTSKFIEEKKKVRCTALPLIKVPIFDTEIMKLSILINQIFIYAKIKDKVFDNEWYGYKVVDVLSKRGQNKTIRLLIKYNIEFDIINNLLNEGQKLENKTLSFIEYTYPYKKAMEYIFLKMAEYIHLDLELYKIIGGDFLILMNLLDAGDDYYQDLNENKFSPLNSQSETSAIKYFTEEVPLQLDKIVNNILPLNHPYETIILNILGEYINSEKNRIIIKLKNKGVESNDDKSKLLRYFRSF